MTAKEQLLLMSSNWYYDVLPSGSEFGHDNINYTVFVARAVMTKMVSSLICAEGTV